jgi:predicted Zn-dependent protease
MRPQEIIESALDASSTDDCTVIVRESSAANLRWAANTLTTNGVHHNREVTVIAYVETDDGSAPGVFSGVVADADDLRRIQLAAEASARSATDAQDANPLITDQSSGDFDEGPESTSAAIFESFASALGESFASSTAAGRELFGYAEHDVTTTYVGSSAGLRLRHVQPTGLVDITGKSANRTRSTWVAAQTRDFSDVNAADLEAHIAQRLHWAERSVSLPPGRYDVVVPPVAVADLMIYLYWTGAAREAAEGRTVFSKPGGGTRVGDRLTDQPLSLYSDPSYPGMQCDPFVVAEASSSLSSVFDNGLPLQRTDWIRNGELNALGQTRHSAQLTGLPVTPMIDNLVLDHAEGQGSMMDLVAGVDDGLLLTTLWYIREVDPQTLLLTGLTRDGVYQIKNGEVVGAVNNFRFNESPVDLLSRVTAASSTNRELPREWSDFFTRTAMPALRVDGFNMSTVSQAS